MLRTTPIYLSREAVVPLSIVFFCEQERSSNNPLREASTLGMDSRVRGYATALHDQKLLAKLSEDDLVSIQAKYLPECLVSLYDRARTTAKEAKEDDDVGSTEGIALSELIIHIEEAQSENDGLTIFKLADLVCMYTSRLQLGVNLPDRVQITRLKERSLYRY